MGNQAYIVHHIPGRLRIRLPKAKGNPDLLARISQSLSPLSGVRQVSTNESTGSVVIHYDPGTSREIRKQLAAQAEEDEIFVLDGDFSTENSEAARSVDNLFHHLNDGVKRTTKDLIDLREIMPFGIAIYAFFWVDRAIGNPLWLSLLMFSFSSYMDLHEPEPGTAVEDSIDALRSEIAALRSEIRAGLATRQEHLSR